MASAEDPIRRTWRSSKARGTTGWRGTSEQPRRYVGKPNACPHGIPPIRTFDASGTSGTRTARRYRRETERVKVPRPQLSIRGSSRRSGLWSDSSAQVTLNGKCKAAGCNHREPKLASSYGTAPADRIVWIGPAQFHLSFGGMMENVAAWRRYGRGIRGWRACR
jgi:hypothetical protein